MGISVYPDDSDEVDVLLQNADTAMYRAKSNSVENYQFYSSSMKEEVRKRLKLSMELRDAVKAGQLEVYYQPQINALTGSFLGVEALLRWNHPQRGLISPANFIPLAEETGLIKEMGRWVLETACTQFVNWEMEGISPNSLSVNLSEKELNQRNIVDIIRTVIKETGIDPGKLEIELTENIVFSNFNKIRIILEEIKNLGVRLAVDDFGTGYSTLSQLAHFKFDTLKIDQRFAPSITTSESDAAIVSGIITIARNLKMNIVAEGIEEQPQLDFYISQGCINIQGYYFAKPLQRKALVPFLQKHRIEREQS